MEDDADDLRALPKDDAIHFVILSRIDLLEKSHNEIEKWRIRADIMLGNVERLEVRFSAEMEKQTNQILGELKSVKTDLKSVLKDQTFWANSRTIARWIIGVSVPLILASWAVFTWVYANMHIGSK